MPSIKGLSLNYQRIKHETLQYGAKVIYTHCCCATASILPDWVNSACCLLCPLQLVDVESGGALSDGGGKEQYHFAVTGKSLAVILEHFPDLVPKVSSESLFAFYFNLIDSGKQLLSQQKPVCVLVISPCY